ncbi:antirestriction protein [Xanthomonas euvesicatoria]|uniref:antirestriction protein n=1 Tax=Xanthomonas euvesicatoria TaxID=456327 RepID=UPI001C44031C|nr:antirestriction protein [Xanthomonas euvesicatoria]MBV6831306.1 antirestriction protein [Xanthomonas campestris pv. viegasii]
MNTQEQPVTASLVAEAQRLDFLPAHFGPRLMMRGEALVYGWLRRLCERYTGAYWHYYTLSDGGFYMAPDLAGGLEIEVDGNGFRGELSADAAGIVATLFALGQLAAETAGTEAADPLIDSYHALAAFATSHPEAAAIYRAID